MSSVLKATIENKTTSVTTHFKDCPRRTYPFVARGVAVYSDFGPVERYISETVQDMS